MLDIELQIYCRENIYVDYTKHNRERAINALVNIHK